MTESNEPSLLVAFPSLQLESQLISGPACLEIMGRLILDAAQEPDFSLLPLGGAAAASSVGVEEVKRVKRLRNPESYRACHSQLSFDIQAAFR